MQDVYVREQLMKMLAWYFGIQTDFQKSPGKMGKYFKEYLEPDLWAQVERTFSDWKPEHIWDSLFAMCNLFRQTAKHVAEHFDFRYPDQDDKNVTRYLLHIRHLPQNAATIY
jgi:aminoglycoside 6-adenylyltransferase